jgi:hypothetical protein
MEKKYKILEIVLTIQNKTINQYLRILFKIFEIIFSWKSKIKNNLICFYIKQNLLNIENN